VERLSQMSSYDVTSNAMWPCTMVVVALAGLVIILGFADVLAWKIYGWMTGAGLPVG
jgi:hypothetical protein